MEEGREMVYKDPRKRRGGAQGKLLLIIATDEISMRPVVSSATRAPRNGASQNVGRRAQPYPPVPLKLESGGKSGFGTTFVHLERKFYQMTL
jgi:hypothetical protein